MFGVALIVMFFGYLFSIDMNKQYEKYSHYPTETTPKIKNRYNPVEVGKNNWFLRRFTQFFRRPAMAADISPINPIPFRANIKERKDLFDGQWGHVNINPKGQYEQIKQKLVYDESHHLLDTYNRIPIGKERWSLDASNYGVFTH